jgi:hypothetical protein
LKRAKRGESDGLVNLFAQLLAFHLKVPTASSKNWPHFTLWLPDNPSWKKWQLKPVVFLTESLQQLLKYRLRRMNVFILFASTIFARFRDTI